MTSTWTKERPKVPGYYWLEIKHGPPRIVRVTERTIKSQYGGDCRWSSQPIREPEDA
ncbi:MAG: hypothetical protein KGL39_18675 [Patescibacteria group bacterium]|nr:hypothetical protein [Patescibacteria group bacterium]